MISEWIEKIRALIPILFTENDISIKPEFYDPGQGSDLCPEASYLHELQESFLF